MKEKLIEKLYKSIDNYNTKIYECDGNEFVQISEAIENIACVIMALEGVRLNAVWSDNK